eukprot:TRINITY_DN81447_c0_g1_i1.p1 TRINITY_DN81447_c0_g1~~TRINITY_DN81447_c0_g1_i1.p1  ORF type:complete len:105 (-),score=7.01 TRINITY_DN81447_c0_g1_i1:199-513(-)
MELSSENLSSLKMSQDLSLHGNNLLSLEDMLLVINIKLQISKSINQENSRLFSLVRMDQLRKCKFITLKEKVELVWECIILMKVLKDLLIAASSLHSTENSHSI